MSDLSQLVEFHISPKIGFSNNNIKLGTTLNRLLDSLSSTSITFIYSTKQLLSTPYIIKINKFRINLIINPSSQRLIFIETTGNLGGNSNIKYLYNGKQLKSFDLKEIYNDIFGPTYNGQVVNDDNYILNYPGISFKFKIPNIDKQKNSTSEEVLNKLFIKNPKAESICIHSFNSYSQIKTNTNIINLLSNPNKIELENVIIDYRKKNKKIILIKFLKHSSNLKSCELILNKSDLQDVLMLIGPPDETFNKDVSKQKIHAVDNESNDNNSKNDSRNDSESCSLIFHNYYSFGLDFLYENNILIKVIIHNNSPLNKLTFGKYEKCQFEMLLKDDNVYESDEEEEEEEEEDDDDSKRYINNDLYFDEIYEIMGMNESRIKPILINKSNYSNSKLELIYHEYDEIDSNINEENGNENKGNNINGKLEFQSLVYVDHNNEQIWEVIDNFLDSLVLY